MSAESTAAEPPESAATPPNPPASATPHVVEFQGVTKRFGEKVVLDNISFEVADLPNMGELITVVGQSGCGKSTLCKLIAGLAPHHPPTKGSVRSFGKLVDGPSSDRGVVDQKYSLLPHLTVLGNVAFGLAMRGVSRKERTEEAMRWIQRIDLEASASKYPHELSGGMQQRVAIAASLILKPRIVLMDEPFGALDPKIRIQMQSLLVELWNELQSTVFFVTHSAEEAVYLGDRVVIMSANPGRIAEVIQVPRPDRPLRVMRKETPFREACDHIREKLEAP